MRGLSQLFAAVVLASQLVSCDEAAEETMVWGTFEPDSNGVLEVDYNQKPQATPENPLSGTLSESGADYVGSCVYSNELFSFTIASGSANNRSASDFSFDIAGIEGPPSQSPFETGSTLRSDESRSIRSGNIFTGAGSWRFNSDDMVEGRCLATLFAEGGDGDLTPLFLGKKKFQYVVKLECSGGLDFVENAQQGVELTGFKGELYFDNCDS